jgi:hypothetical protein
MTIMHCVSSAKVRQIVEGSPVPSSIIIIKEGKGSLQECPPPSKL